jgi:hypothetical protein
VKLPRTLPWWIVAPLALLGCCILLYASAEASFSPGVPQGNCSAKGLLLDQTAFPPRTSAYLSENFEDFAVQSASQTFANRAPALDLHQAVVYYNATFASWQDYTYNSGIFKRTRYNDGWQYPQDAGFSSRAASQYHFACTNDTVIGPTCIFQARYGRYLVLVSSGMSDGFTVCDLVPLLKIIDSRMARCKDK